MLPGPVFYTELLTTARRGRYYIIRFGYGLLLLFFFWQVYDSSIGFGQELVSIGEMSNFAQSIFWTLVATQGLTVLFLTPAFTAGVVADERQRKTLHYLLASQLTSPEIVLGKLAAKLLHLAVILAIGLPIISLLSLFGGVDPLEIGLVYVVTISSMLFVASLSVGISAFARRVRDAIMGTYLVCLLWLSVPSILISLVSSLNGPITSIVNAVCTPFLVTNPFWFLSQSGGISSNSLSEIAWMLTGQSIFSLLFLGMATFRLRPSFRNEGAQRRKGKRRLGRSGKEPRPRLFPRPPIGTNPMLWKERYSVRLGLVARIAGSFVALGVIGATCVTLYDLGFDAFGELLTFGYSPMVNYDSRESLNEATRIIGALTYILIGLGVAVGAASSIAVEREQDTWTSLLTTDLSSTEILKAKMLGAVWSLRWFFLPIGVVWIVSTLAGALHLFGLLLSIFVLGIFVWYAVSLGTYFSLTSKTTTRALSWTVGLMLLSNLGYLIIAVWFINDPIVLVGCTPMILWLAGLSFEEVWQLSGFLDNSNRYNYSLLTNDEGMSFILASLLGLVSYFLAAQLLSTHCFKSFDAIQGRPSNTTTIDPKRTGVG